MKKVLLIGNGGREHALAEALKRSPQEISLVVYGKALNPGILELADEYALGAVTDVENIVKFALKEKPDFAVVGPEAPIEAGVVDALLAVGIHSASPMKTVGRLESSKSFTRDLLEKYSIPGNPKYKVFFSDEGLHDFIDQFDGQFVIKADGLKGGKGVFVADDHFSGGDEGYEIAKKAVEEDGRVVIEEKFVGQEFSLMSFTDGKTCVEMPVIQDHKRAFEGDKGPNTGGMGTYSDANHSLPFLKDEDIQEAAEITKKVATALFEETGCYFKGVMYGGFMATKNGVRLIEYNARFGDPEALNVLPLFESDFVALCEAIIAGDLDETEFSFSKKATVCKYVVPEGYPTNSVKNKPLEIGETPEGVKLFFAAVDQQDDQLVLTGSRTIGVVGIADTIAAAEQLAEQGVAAIKGPVFHRKDIGTAALIDARIEMMKALRS